VALWTFIWYAGIIIFAALSVIVIIFGARDLTAMLGALKARHLAQQEQAIPPDGDSA